MYLLFHNDGKTVISFKKMPWRELATASSALLIDFDKETVVIDECRTEETSITAIINRYSKIEMEKK